MQSHFLITNIKSCTKYSFHFILFNCRHILEWFALNCNQIHTNAITLSNNKIANIAQNVHYTLFCSIVVTFLNDLLWIATKYTPMQSHFLITKEQILHKMFISLYSVQLQSYSWMICFELQPNTHQCKHTF